MSHVQHTMTKDCCLMLEAIRRLIEGTCCLEGEEVPCVWDLFGKLYTAFTEHVEFEEAHILPKLSATARARHDAEHLKLREIIEKARWEFEHAEGDSFRDRLRELSTALIAHHEGDADFDDVDLDDAECPQDLNFQDMSDRAEIGIL